MRDVNRIGPFLNQLQKLWELYPDYRFGQLIYMLADELGKDVFFPEEDEWLDSIIDLKNKQEEYLKNNPIEYVGSNEMQQLIKAMLDDRENNKRGSGRHS